jgi:hypothetical protein
MAGCQIVTSVVPEGDGRNYYADAPMRAVHHCQAHGMNDFVCHSVDGINALCPVGLIERAVEDGLAKIAAAAR